MGAGNQPEVRAVVPHCIVCCTPIPSVRAARGSTYCCDEHRRTYRNWRRAQLAIRRCRLCGRAARKPISKPISIGMGVDTCQPKNEVSRACALGAQVASNSGHYAHQTNFSSRTCRRRNFEER